MKKLLSFLLAGLVSAPAVFSSVVAYSPLVGGNTLTLTGASGGVPKITSFSPALRLTVGPSFVGKARGTFTAVTDTVFTDTTAGWSAAALSQPAAPYFVRIRSGAASGTWWQISTSTANTVSAFTILNRSFSPTGLGIAPGDTYELVPGDTLGSFFGDIAASIGGASAATADAIRVHDGNIWKEYFYKTTDSKWHEGASSFDRTNIVLRPDAGIVFVRKSAGDISLMVTGVVSDADEKVLIPSTGVTFVASVFPVARKLGSLDFQNLPGFVRYTGDTVVADKVTLHNGTLWKNYNYNLSDSKWHEGASSFDRTNIDIPFGTPFLIVRGTGAAGSASLLTLVKPY